MKVDPTVSGKTRELPAVQNLAVGGLAGALAKTTIAPLERVKILFQISSKKKFSLRAAFRTLGAIAVNEGTLALWKGNGAQIIRIFPYAGIQFSSHEIYKKALRKEGATELHPVLRFLVGSMAGTTAVVFTYPLDLLRARLAVQTPNLNETHYGYLGLGHAFRTMAKAEGWRSLYKGLAPTLMGIVPYGGLSFSTYETLRARLVRQRKGETPTTTQLLACGGIAGLVAQTATYPLDVVRRRMQTEKGQSRYKNVLHVFKDILEHESWRGLYKGVSMNWIKGPIAVGISFTTFDTLKTRLLREQHD